MNSTNNGPAIATQANTTPLLVAPGTTLANYAQYSTTTNPDGSVTVNGLMGVGGGVYPIFFPAMNAPYASASAAISACALAAFNAGGGVVKLPAATIALTASLPLYNGVTYEGTGFADSQIPGILEPLGTKLVGDGTFPAFAYNSADQGVAPTVYNTFVGQLVRGVRIRELTVKNFSYGIKIGALWNAGCRASEFVNIYALNCGWGFWFENFISCKFEGLYSVNSTLGMGVFAGSGGSALNNGNSVITRIAGENQGSSTIRTRCWLFMSRGTGTTTSLNGISGINVSSANNRLSSTQAATMANASANITVTDGTQFAVDMPVIPTSTQNGFAIGQTYFVVSVAANVIQLSDTVGGAAKSATGNAAINISTYGFPGIEVIGYGTNTIQPCEFRGVDLEGGATVRGVIQNAMDLKIVTQYVEGTNMGFWQFALRNSANTYLEGTANGGGNVGLTIDADAGSASTRIFGPRAQSFGGGQAAQSGQGISTYTNTDSRIKTNTQIINLTGSFGPDITVNKLTGTSEIPRVGFVSVTFASGGAVAGSGTNLNVYSGAGGGNATLPTIQTNGDGLALFISNPSNGTLTLNTGGSQTVNGAAGVFSFVMPANSMCTAMACNNGGTLFWAIK